MERVPIAAVLDLCGLGCCLPEEESSYKPLLTDYHWEYAELGDVNRGESQWPLPNNVANLQGGIEVRMRPSKQAVEVARQRRSQLIGVNSNELGPPTYAALAVDRQREQHGERGSNGVDPDIGFRQVVGTALLLAAERSKDKKAQREAERKIKETVREISCSSDSGSGCDVAKRRNRRRRSVRTISSDDSLLHGAQIIANEIKLLRDYLTEHPIVTTCQGPTAASRTRQLKYQGAECRTVSTIDSVSCPSAVTSHKSPQAPRTSHGARGTSHKTKSPQAPRTSHGAHGPDRKIPEAHHQGDSRRDVKNSSRRESFRRLMGGRSENDPSKKWENEIYGGISPQRGAWNQFLGRIKIHTETNEARQGPIPESSIPLPKNLRCNDYPDVGDSGVARWSQDAAIRTGRDKASWKVVPAVLKGSKPEGVPVLYDESFEAQAAPQTPRVVAGPSHITWACKKNELQHNALSVNANLVLPRQLTYPDNVDHKMKACRIDPGTESIWDTPVNRDVPTQGEMKSVEPSQPQPAAANIDADPMAKVLPKAKVDVQPKPKAKVDVQPKPKANHNVSGSSREPIRKKETRFADDVNFPKTSSRLSDGWKIASAVSFAGVKVQVKRSMRKYVSGQGSNPPQIKPTAARRMFFSSVSQDEDESSTEVHKEASLSRRRRGSIDWGAADIMNGADDTTSIARRTSTRNFLQDKLTKKFTTTHSSSLKETSIHSYPYYETTDDALLVSRGEVSSSSEGSDPFNTSMLSRSKAKPEHKAVPMVKQGTVPPPSTVAALFAKGPKPTNERPEEIFKSKAKAKSKKKTNHASLAAALFGGKAKATPPTPPKKEAQKKGFTSEQKGNQAKLAAALFGGKAKAKAKY